jgi:RHS repeat-associated protein
MYDNAGDVSADGVNGYLYDAEGRICAVNTGSGWTGYLYNASGQRVAKGTITNWSAGCNIAQNGFTLTRQYILGPNGEQMTEIAYSGGVPTPVHTNVVAGGVIATYLPNDSASPHFRFADWLGTTRAQANNAGTLELTCQSLPFGDTSAQCTPATEQFYTGQERDQESGNDYFQARHYANSMGRFLSPDPSGLLLADLTNPQSLNLYSYVLNSPLTSVDPTGLDDCTVEGMPVDCGEVNSEAFVQCPNNACSGVQWNYKTINGNTQFMGGALTQFQSYADGSSGYVISGLTDAQLGTLTANIQYNKAVNDYMKIANVDRATAENWISRDSAHMEGGHWNFLFSGPDPRSGTDDKEFRFSGSTLHIPKPDPLNPGTFIHDDTFNPTPIWEVWNLALHGLVDYAGGHTLFQGGFTF